MKKFKVTFYRKTSSFARTIIYLESENEANAYQEACVEYCGNSHDKFLETDFSKMDIFVDEV